MTIKLKYLKYKNKYLALKYMLYGGNRNKCTYGIKCFRENLQHILDYDHEEINRERFNKIIEFYKKNSNPGINDISTEMNKDESIFKYKNGHQFGMILWVLENLKKFKLEDKKIIRQYFSTLEEFARVDPILLTRDRKDKVIFRKKLMTVDKLWENELSNTKILFSIELK
jgi:hypothetical protein